MSAPQPMTESMGPQTPPRMVPMGRAEYGESGSPFSGLKMLSLLASPHQKGMMVGGRRPNSTPPGQFYPDVQSPLGMQVVGPQQQTSPTQGDMQMEQGGMVFSPVPGVWIPHVTQEQMAASIAAGHTIRPQDMQWAAAAAAGAAPQGYAVTPPYDRRRSSSASSDPGTPYGMAMFSPQPPGGMGGGGAELPKKASRSRKEKSLGLLSENFLRMFTGHDNADICLDAVAKQLGVERRRIYDIVNVLEGVEVVSRREKNRYTWLGVGGINQTLSRLKALAGASAVPDARKRGDYAKHSGPDAAADDNLTDKQKSSRSLGILAQRFVMMFMSSPTRVVRLEDAAECLVFQGCEEAKHKTKVRRLYDIANVLCSLRLIAKTSILESRAPKKPAFVWIGIDLDDVIPDPSGLQDQGPNGGRTRARKQSLLRAPDDEPETETPTGKRPRTRLYSPSENGESQEVDGAQWAESMERASESAAETPGTRPYGLAEAARRNVYGIPKTSEDSEQGFTSPTGSKYSSGNSQETTPQHGRPKFSGYGSSPDPSPGEKRPLATNDDDVDDDEEGDVFD